MLTSSILFHSYIVFGVISTIIVLLIVAIFISMGPLFSHSFEILNSICFNPLLALFMSLLENSFALSETLLPMLGPKFIASFVSDSDGGFRSRSRFSLNVQLSSIKAYCSFLIFFGFLLGSDFFRKTPYFLPSFTGALAHYAHVLLFGARIKFKITLMFLIDRVFVQVWA